MGWDKGDKEDLVKKPTDPKTLSYDSMYAAQLRMIWDYARTNRYNPIDLIIVFGDPNKSVSANLSIEEITKEFIESSEKRRDFLKSIESSLKKAQRIF